MICISEQMIMSGFRDPIVTTKTIRVLFSLFISLLTIGCGASSAGKGQGPNDEHMGSGINAKESVKLRELSEEQEERIAELEVRLSLLEAEAREIRNIIQVKDIRKSKETIRIGGKSEEEQDDDIVTDNSTVELDDNPRPILHIYGSRKNTVPVGPIELPPRPASIPERLPVVPLPGQQLNEGRNFQTISGQQTSDKEQISEYRKALGLVKNGSLDEALQVLNGLLSQYPNHVYTDRVMYWRGEIYYAKREYTLALVEFNAVTTRFPSSKKVPDSLLKIAMCYQHLGDTEEAQNFFKRVQRQYPDSNAARIASAEDAS